MPFESKAQLRACYARKRQMEREGKTSNWDCHKWYYEGGGKEAFNKLPEYKNSSQPRKPSTRRKSQTRPSRKPSRKPSRRN